MFGRKSQAILRRRKHAGRQGAGRGLQGSNRRALRTQKNRRGWRLAV